MESGNAQGGGPPAPAAAPASPLAAARSAQFRDPREVFRLHPLLYQLFYDLGGDFAKIQERLAGLRETSPGDLVTLADVTARAMQHLPDNPVLSFVAGALQMSQGRPLSAMVAFKRSLDLCSKLDDHSNALVLIDTLEETFPDDLTLGERRADHLAKLERREDACQTLEVLGDLHLGNRRHIPAAQCFWRALQYEPGRRALGRKLVDALVGAPHRPFAVDTASRMLLKDPQSPFLCLARGLVRKELGEDAPMSADFEGAVNRASQNVEDLLILQKAFTRHGELERARALNQRLNELDPDQKLRGAAQVHLFEGTAHANAPDAAHAQSGDGPPSGQETEQGSGRSRPSRTVRDATDPRSIAAEPEPRRRTWSLVAQWIMIAGVIGGLWFTGWPLYQDFVATQNSQQLKEDEQHIQSWIQISDASGTPYADWSLRGLAGASDVPTDPWGNEYIYDWMQGRIISRGPDGVLQTAVTGFSEKPAKGGTSDDVILRARPFASRLLFMRAADGASKVLAAYLDDLVSSPVLETSWKVLGLDDLPARRLLLLTGELEGGDVGVFVDEVHRGKLTRLVMPAGDVCGAVWADSQGQSIVYQTGCASGSAASLPQGGSRTALHRIALDPVHDYATRPGSQVDISKGLDEAWDPSVQLGNGMVYFAGRRAQSAGIYRVTTGTPTPELLLSREGMTLVAPVPSPDGRYLAFFRVSGGFSIKDDTEASLDVIDVASRETILTVDGALARSYPQWAPSSDRVAWIRAASGANRLCITHIDKRLTVDLDLSGLLPCRFAWEPPVQRGWAHSGVRSAATAASAEPSSPAEASAGAATIAPSAASAGGRSDATP